MRPVFFTGKHTKSLYVKLNTRKCKACLRCSENCPEQIIGKVDLTWHKHALIIEPHRCSGCLKCVEVCRYDAFSCINKTIKETDTLRKSILKKFIVNILLLISGIIITFSGLTLQSGFHIGGTGKHQEYKNSIQSQSTTYEQARGVKPDKIVCGFNYYSWSTIHKVSIVVFSLLVIYHVYAHWKWYKAVLTKHLIKKNIQVIVLPALFMLVAITGLVPWITDLSGNTSALRFILIEIHDKLTLILVIYLFLHVLKRNKWFFTTYKNLKK
jgi:Pyruvate/2-oxoacid:ferredoxin oxidoreductase delta subunit